MRLKPPNLCPHQALLAVGLIPSAATAWWLIGDPNGLGVLGSCIAAIAGLALVLSVVYMPAALWVVVTRSGRSVYETMPREMSGPVLVVPIATTVSTSFLSVGVAVGTLTFGDSPAVDPGSRRYWGALCLVGFVIGIFVPWLVAHLIRLERAGADVAILDSAVPAPLVHSAIERRWDQLVQMKRYWYPNRRLRALGVLIGPAADPGRTGKRGGVVSHLNLLIAGLAITNVVCVGVLTLESKVDLSAASWIAVIALVVLPGSLAALAVALIGFTLTAQEQKTATRLRMALVLAAGRAAPVVADRVVDREAAGRQLDVAAVEVAVRERLKLMSRAELLSVAFAKGRSWR